MPIFHDTWIWQAHQVMALADSSTDFLTNTKRVQDLTSTLTFHSSC